MSRCFAYYGSSSSSTNEKLDKVNEKLEILTNEVNRLADATAALTDSERSPVDPVTLVAINRSPTDEGHVFTIHYKKNEADVFTKIIVDDSSQIFVLKPDSKDEDDDKISSLTFTCDQVCKDATAVFVFFSNTSESSSLKLGLDNSGTRAMFQNQFTNPLLEILHSGDLVYNPGSDVQVKVVSSYGRENDFRYSSLTSSLRVVELENGAFTYERGEHWIERRQQKRFLETKETTLVVRTSEHSISGLLDVTLTFTATRDPLLKSVEVVRSVVVRPTDQEGPFPTDFLEFKYTGDIYLNGVVRKMCRAGSTCVYDCSAFGTSITALDIRLKDENNETEPVDTIYDSGSTFDYSRTVQWAVEPTEDSQGDMVYECIAHTASKNLTRETRVIVQSEMFYIDRNNSFIDLQADETHPGFVNVTIACAVVGRPVWDVEFQASYAGDMFYHVPLETQLSRNGNHAVATATIHFNPEYNTIDGLRAMKCLAHGYGQYDDYILDMPTDVPTRPESISTF